jgi:hypothetical protein
MADFDPDVYLSQVQPQKLAFDPDAYLASSQAPSLATQEIQPQMGLADMMFDPQTAQNLREGIQDVVYSIPGMAAQIPKMAYEGLKFAVGGPQERAQIGEEALTQAVVQGQQMAKDVQAPLGSRESFRGLANLGLMAVPAIGESVGELAMAGEKPPVQARPQIPEGQITDLGQQQQKTGGEINAEQISEPTQVHGDVQYAPRPEESAQLPAPVSSEGVQTRGQGETLQQTPQEVAQPVPQPEQPEPVSQPTEATTAQPLTETETAAPLPKSETVPTTEEPPVEKVQSEIPAKPEVVPRTREAANQAAISLESKDPEIGRKTVQKVIKTNSASDDIEQAVIMREFNKSRDDYESAIDAVNSSIEGSPEQAVAMSRLKETEKRFQDATDASYKSGTATARGLGFRAGNGEFSMARMLRQLQAHNAGKRLTPELMDTTRELSGKLNAVGERIAANSELSRRTEALLKEYAVKRVSIKSSDISKTATKAFLEDAASRAMERIKQRRAEGRLYTGIDAETLYDHAVIGAHYLAKGVTAFSKWSAEMLDNVGEHVRPFLKDIFDQSKRVLESTLSTDKRLASYKKRLGTNYEKLKAKIDSGDFTKPERQKMAVDRQTSELRKEYDDLKNQWRKELNLREKVNAPGWRKALDTATEYLRAEKLTGLGTLGKIASAATQRPIATVLEDIAGRAVTAIPTIRQIAQGAPTENPILSSLGKYPGGVARGIKEFPDVVRGKNEPAEYSARGPDVFQYPGRLHGATKNPIKQAEYDVGLDRASKWAEREQLDPTDPEVSAQIHEFAKQRGLRGIWMNDNAASRLFRNAMSSLEHSGDAGFVASRVGRIMLPIIRVPTNVAIEAGRYHFGLANASVRVGHALVKGVDTLSPIQKDLIMTNLKKGSVGAGLFALGYIYHDQLGGFYNEATYKGKEKQTGLRPLEAKLFGVNIPSWVAHSPLMLTLHAGATFHDMMETKHGTALGSEIAVLGGILENVPFINEASRLDDIIRGGQNKAQKAIGGWFRGQVFPVMVQEMARWTDQHDANGHPIKRYPQSMGEELKLGAPGLRQQVQETKPNQKASRNRPR